MDTLTEELVPQPAAVTATDVPPSRWRRLTRGRAEDPAWVRPSLIVLLIATAGLYLWNLGASGWANAYYSAAVQAATESWKAFFFGSFDSSNFTTVDKTPGSLWVMALSARLFGVNAWSILVPQALMGVASVGLLHAAVRRAFTPPAGLIAGAVLALTPVATLMFRFNNPDALLTLLLVGAAYALTRAIERAGTRWLVLCGTLVGFAFLAKMLQAFIVLPVFGLVYLVCAPASLRRRMTQAFTFGASVVASAGWWIAVVTMWPAGSRPYIGGSQSNSVIELMFGYNGLGRLTGNEAGSVGGGPPGAGGRWGETGLLRLFNASNGGQVAWLIPAALILLGVLLYVMRRAPRTDVARAAVFTWGGWLVLTGLVFSLAQGIFHEYYNVVLAPAIGAVVGIGAVATWQRRDATGRGVLAATLAITSVWAFVLLGRSPSWLPGLRVLVLLAGVAVACAMLAPKLAARTAAVLAGAGIAAALAGPAAYSLETASTPHTGAIPSAGPRVAGAMGGPGRVPMPGGQNAQDGNAQDRPAQMAVAPPLNGRPGGLNVGPPRFVGDGDGGTQAAPFQDGRRRFMGGGLGGGSLGGLLDTREPDEDLVRLLEEDADRYTWIAASVGSMNASGVQLATGDPVMAIGGFNGTDPSISLERFKEYVARGEIHYFLSGGDRGGPGGRFGPGGGSGSSSEIVSWVQENFTSRTVGGVTVYDLTTVSSIGSGAV